MTGSRPVEPAAEPAARGGPETLDGGSAAARPGMMMAMADPAAGGSGNGATGTTGEDSAKQEGARQEGGRLRSAGAQSAGSQAPGIAPPPGAGIATGRTGVTSASAGGAVAGGPCASVSGTGGAGSGKPSPGDPVAGDPVAGGPVTGGPGAGGSVAGGPVTGDPVTGDPVAGDPGAGDPGAGAGDADPPLTGAATSETSATSGEGGYHYLRDGAAIYARSFAIIRAEADLSALSPAEARVAVRLIHACGMVEIAAALRFAPGFTQAARAALLAGAPVLCDSQMLAHGITRARLPADNAVVCTLAAPEVPALAARLATTRSAAALDLWGARLAGAVVAIGNAPTALFRLLELLEAGAPPPAAVIGLPVGFVGAAESKQALAAQSRVPFLVLHGRQGGSAMAAAVVNALASEAE